MNDREMYGPNMPAPIAKPAEEQPTFGELMEPLEGEPEDAHITPFHDQHSAPHLHDDAYDEEV
jgi:hypothetical protein